MNFQIRVIRKSDDTVRFEVAVDSAIPPTVLDFMELVKDLEVFKAQLLRDAANGLKAANEGVNVKAMPKDQFESMMNSTVFPGNAPKSEVVN